MKLATEADFALGGLAVRPSLREVGCESWHETLEPRVMEVLVALAHARGAVVSRDALIESCWSGRKVSDDAIERCIVRLRKLLERDANFALSIETIPKIGYRLIQPLAVDHPSTRPESAAVAGQSAAMLQRNYVGAIVRWWPAGLVVLGVGLLLHDLWPVDRPAWSVSSLQMLTAQPTEAFSPALAPNGSMIAYAAGADDRPVRHIFVRNLAGGDALRLTNDSAADASPVWSPGSDRIAFVRHREGHPCEILITSVPLGQQTSVGRCVVDESTQLAWSPDGRFLYFSDRQDHILPDRIVSLDLQTGARRFVTNPNKLVIGDFAPAVSPDGTRLAFERIDGGDQLVYVDELATGMLGQIGGREPDARGIAWSSDGTTLFVAIERPSGSAIWAFSPSGGGSKRLTLNSLEYGLLASGPGNLLGFESRNERFNVAAPSRNPAVAGSPFLTDLQHGLPDQLDIARGGSLAASLAYEGEQTIWTKRPGQTWRRLGNFSVSALFNPRWSPDGKQIAFAAAKASAEGLFVASADSGYPRLVVPVALNSVNPSIWSADGTALIYPVFNGEGWRIWRAELDGKRAPAPLSDWGWCSVRELGGALYGSRVDHGGIWKIASPPVLIAGGLPRDRCYD